MIFFILPLIIEAITEFLTESYFLESFRNLFAKRERLGVLVKCGYCISFWVTIPFVFLCKIPIIENRYVEILVSYFILQRMSNLYHHIIMRIKG